MTAPHLNKLNLPVAHHREGQRHTIGSLRLTEHWFTVPATHGLYFGAGKDAAEEHPAANETITVFAREVVDASDQLTRPVDERPFMVYLQGGPGAASPRPTLDSGWVAHLAKTHRLVLLDQRGTGNSTPLSSATITARGDLEAQVRYLELFRADSIVADAEVVRSFLLAGRQDQRWSTMGQSFGGFLTLSYLSFAPYGLKDCRMTAGLAPIRTQIDQVYQATYSRMAERNEQYYSWYPEDRELARTIADFIGNEEVRMPTGERLSVQRFQMLGHYLGGNTRAHGLHYVLQSAFAEGPRRLSEQFLAAVSADVTHLARPLYAVLHESIYADGPADGSLPGVTGFELSPSPAPTGWSAARVGAQRPEFSPEASCLYFTGEHVFPWYFEQDPALVPLRDLAEALAEKDDWGRLYDHRQLAENQVPLAAAAYVPDVYVDYENSMATARWVKNTAVWTSATHHHDGLGQDGTLILDHLKNLLADMR